MSNNSHLIPREPELFVLGFYLVFQLNIAGLG